MKIGSLLTITSLLGLYLIAPPSQKSPPAVHPLPQAAVVPRVVEQAAKPPFGHVVTLVSVSTAPYLANTSFSVLGDDLSFGGNHDLPGKTYLIQVVCERRIDAGHWWFQYNLWPTRGGGLPYLHGGGIVTGNTFADQFTSWSW